MDAVVNAPGGVMTDEVGVITGELTVRTTLDGNQVTIEVQYKDADEWYHVNGGKFALSDSKDADTVHKLVVSLLHRPE